MKMSSRSKIDHKAPPPQSVGLCIIKVVRHEDLRAVESAMEASGMASTVTEIVSGGAKGVDRLGECYACQHDLPCKVFPAQWAKHGRSAGPLRNMEMAKYADYGVAIWDGMSRGTAHMIRLMEGRVFVWRT